MSGVAGVLRRRRMLRDHYDTLRANDGLYDVSRDLRRRAQAQINAGHPERAVPYLDEARLFESAVQPVPGL